MYNKIFTKILDSSIWLEPDATRIVWLTCIAAMDEDGYCAFAAPANLAHRANVTLTACRSALETLEGPDANSSDPDNDGRRLERVSGGWIVRNAAKYRDLITRAVSREQTRQRVRRYREKKRNGNASVTPDSLQGVTCNASEAVSESRSDSKAETHKNPVNRTALTRSDDALFDEFWIAYPRKKAKDDARKAWHKRRPDAALLAVMLEALAQQRQSADWLRDGGKFIPYPATWLSGARWTDAIDVDSRPPGLSDTARHNLASMTEMERILRERETGGQREH